VDFAMTRLQSICAQKWFRSFGLVDLLGALHMLYSTEEAIRALGRKRPGE
jgi:hypothetical protein